MGYILIMQTVVELETYTRKAEKLFSEHERSDIIDYIAVNPGIGDEIPGTGGVRKVRVQAKGKGKRGGARVVYFVYNDDLPIYLLACYGKGERADLSPDQKKVVKAFATALKATAKSRRQKK